MWSSISNNSYTDIEAIHFDIELLRYLNPISRVFRRYRRFFVISDIELEANNSISKVVYSTLKKPSISKPSILKKSSILGVARFQMEKLEYPQWLARPAHILKEWHLRGEHADTCWLAEDEFDVQVEEEEYDLLVDNLEPEIPLNRAGVTYQHATWRARAPLTARPAGQGAKSIIKHGEFNSINSFFLLMGWISFITGRLRPTAVHGP
jgi:hypothetical protein